MNQVKRGRKPLEDKKKPITIFLKDSQIQQHGGVESVKKKILDYFTITAIILTCLLIENVIQL